MSKLCLLLLVVGKVFGQQSRVEAFQQSLRGQLILAPLTRGGNLPFRRLCSETDMFRISRTGDLSGGANMTMSEMAFARMLLRGNKFAVRKERALLKRHPTELNFGFQIATKSAEEAIRAIALAEEGGTTWVDLNCGCPIFEATRRGLGAEMLKKPDGLKKLVGMIVSEKESDIPFTVKIRLGPSDSAINVEKVVEGLIDAGVAAVTIHGRTMTQRYTRPANWDLISKVGSSSQVPIIGNGDILTHFEARDRLAMQGIDALMVGRGALIKPWIFEEFSRGYSLEPTAEERIVVYHRLSQYFKDHFGEDEFGKRHAFYFLPWHFGFFCRYRPLPENLFHDMAMNAPLIQNTRLVDDYLQKSSPLDQRDQLWSQAPLEKLLRSDDTDIHMQISELLWGSSTSEEAVASLRAFAIKADADGIFSQRLSDSTLRTTQNDAASTWEVGGTGPRGDPKNSSGSGAGTLPSSNLSSSDSTSKSPHPRSRRRTELSSRWTPLSPEEHMKVLDFRVGVVVDSTPHPEADNLAINRVDLGATLGVRTIITGRADKTASLVGKKLAVLVNLKPRLLFNVKSEGLILSARGHAQKGTKNDVDHEEITWGPVFAPDDCKPGETISCDGIQVIGHENNNQMSPNRVQRAFKAVAEINLFTTDSGIAVFAGSGSGDKDKDKDSDKALEMKVASGKPCFSAIANGKIS